MAKKTQTSLGEISKLDAGENQYGPAPEVIDALCSYKGYQYYPDPRYKDIRSTISSYLSVPVDSIAVGNGADELIDLLLRLVLEVGDTVVDAPPTFSMYALAMTLNRGVLVSVPRLSDYALHTSAMVQAAKNAKVTIICNPNNPTGNSTPREDIVKILDTGSLVIVDEAYAEYSNTSVVPLVELYPNLVVLRTFSKWAGIAGLRIGYTIADPSLIRELNKIQQPYRVNSAADRAAQAALHDDTYYSDCIKRIISEREQLYFELCNIPGIKVFPSGGNFLFVQMCERLQRLRALAIDSQIALKYYDTTLTGKAVRITIGRPEQNKKVLALFKAL